MRNTFSSCFCLHLFLVGVLFTGLALATSQLHGDESDVQSGAKSGLRLEIDGAEIKLTDNVLSIELSGESLRSGKFVMPRLCASMRSVRWSGNENAALKFVPEPTTWVFTWKETQNAGSTIDIVFDAPPVLPADCPREMPTGDGSVMLHAFQASTFGEKLRFEPQAHKNTVGYWTIPTDYATWKLNIDQPGTYTVAALQGCGKGQGGSDAKISLLHDDKSVAELQFKTIDTGHFQNFRWNHLGKISISVTGHYELRLAPIKIAKNALFDVRMIHLVRQATD